MKIYIAGYTATGNIREKDSEPGSPRRLISYADYMRPNTKMSFIVAIAIVGGDWEKVKMISKKRIY